VRRYRFARQFLRDFRALDPETTESDATRLDAAIASVVAAPERRGRFAAFYDPDRPSWLT